MQVSDYLLAHNELDKLAGVALKRIQHFYYKTGSLKSVQLLSCQAPAFLGSCSIFLAVTAPKQLPSADVVYAAMRKLALQRQQDSAEAPEVPTPALEAEVVDGEEAEGATGEHRG